MSYNIEPMSVKQFVTDAQLKLPRFQRKATWVEKQNFELAISIFQDYPVGVVIVNKEFDSSWLLDGRQRRNALKEMRANPNSVYMWAKKYIGFKANEDTTELKKKYWGKVEEYLQKDKTEEENEQETNEEDFSAEDSFDAAKQRRGLETLLEIILMVHQFKTVGGRQMGAWERTFDFTQYFSRLSYAPQREGGKIKPEKLRDYLLKLGNEVPNLTIETFREYYEDNFELPDYKRLKFEAEVSQKWNEIRNCINVILLSEKIIDDARIGIIQLTNVSPLDAQNIFSRINSGGTQLKAEELLSAKPFWNEKVSTNNAELKEIVSNLYQKLGVETPKDIVKWDLAATFINRVKDESLLFDQEEIISSSEINMNNVTLGFKTLSSIFLGGMSAKVVNELEKRRDISWNFGIDKLADDVNKICNIFLCCDFFRYLQSWKKPIQKLMGNAIVLEFLAIIYKDWKEKGMPTAGAKMTAIERDAKVLFDRLVFEYATGAWRGSGDSKMANHIANWKERIIPVSTDAWKILIEGACKGEYNGQPIVLKHLTPILYYSYVLRNCSPLTIVNTEYEVDHIIPQAKFVDNSNVDKKLKDSLINIALLPKKDNISKKDKELREITTSWLKQSITNYTAIQECDFEKYSDIANINDMKELRKTFFLKIFGETRTTQLAN